MINDVDVAKVEPEIFSLTVFGGQVRCGGTNGIVAGTQFTASGVDFSASQVAGGHVIWLESVDGSIKGAFEIVSAIDSTHLTASQIRSDPSDEAIPVGSASGLTWRIKTLAPQIASVETELSTRLRLKPGNPVAAYAINVIQNMDAIKEILTAMLLVRCYTSLYTASTDADTRAGYEQKRGWYQRQAEKLLAGVSEKLPVS